MSNHKVVVNSIILACLCIFSPLSLMGQYNQLPRISRVQKSIMSILKDLNYEPRINSGVISFTDDSRTFSLECSEETDTLFFGKLSVFFEYNENETYERVNRFSLSHNFKATKILQAENGYSFRSEFYFSDPYFIFESLDLFLSTIRKAESMLKAYCIAPPEDRFVRIDSLKVSLDQDITPKTINGSLFIFSNHALGDTISLYIRIYSDNSLLIDDHSPSDFSFVEMISIVDNQHTYVLAPWELPETVLPLSSLRYEVWDSMGRYLYSVTILSDSNNSMNEASNTLVKNETYQPAIATENKDAKAKAQKAAEGTFLNPRVTGQLTTSAKIRKVIITDEYTCIEVSANRSSSGIDYESCSIDEATYLVNEDKPFEKLKLIKASGIKVAPEKTYFSEANNSITFKLYFPAIPKDTKSISLIEPDSSWCFFGITLHK